MLISYYKDSKKPKKRYNMLKSFYAQECTNPIPGVVFPASGGSIELKVGEKAVRLINFPQTAGNIDRYLMRGLS